MDPPQPSAPPEVLVVPPIPSAPPNEETTLTVSVVKPGEKKGECCVICLEEFKDAPADAKLGCEHQFHHWCIREWLSHNNTCPVCRYGEQC
jgi:hypothetical protein